ncbi:BrnA antitoxin family protein [Argonema galeatum]|uniref:BrnA antitoxin family protein n=1 Tax=Argonema galeatum TaxID=2942762 RepID=UPI0020135536|nr:BrnA antitoxin family protein [Argonema galeatum]MCL1468433.1 BrnA antitoxin family protein [Argonema galeatum A003/A1]
MKEEYDFSQAKRGAIDPIPPGKTRITIRLDDEILAWFRAEVNAAGGGNYQTLINNALSEYIQQRKEPLAEILRRVLREELQRLS